MERLTKVDDQGRLLAYSISDTGLPTIIMKGNPYRELIERLKAYEDTGLEPGEVQYLKDKSEPRMVVWTPAYQSYYSAGDEAECLCPVCDSDVVEDDDYFCPTCGQALKYHDEPN